MELKLPDWDALNTTKAALSFDIVWAFITIWLFAFCFAYHLLPKTPKPYKILACATLSAFGYYIMEAVYVRGKKDLSPVIYDRVVVAIGILYAIAVVLQPAAALSVTRRFGSRIQSIPPPLITRPWKRALDWGLVVITFAVYIAATGINAAYTSATRGNTLSTSQAQVLSRTYDALGHTATGLVVLLSLDVVLSSIYLIRAAEWDPRVSHIIIRNSSSNPFFKSAS